MSVRALLATGLLAAGVFASPPGYGSSTTTTVSPPGYGSSTSTSTSTSTSKSSSKSTSSTSTKDYGYGRTKTVTVTKPASTVTKPASTVTVTGGASTITVPASTVTVAGSCSATTGGSSTSRSSTTGGSSVTSATTTTSSRVNTSGTTTLVATATSTSYGLNDAAKAAGKLFFGTAADIPGTGENQDPYYMAEFNNTHDFGEATPANTMKWFATEPQQGVFNFTGGDYFIDLAHAAGKPYVRCHNLVWMSQLPTWVTNPTTPWTNETLLAVIYNHAYTLVSHFGDRCYSWDVVNEALADSPAGAWQDNMFYNISGPSYFFTAFQAATDAVRAGNLKVQLAYNDYNIEYIGNKSIAAQGLVQDIKARGLQINTVGLESHFIGGGTPSTASQEANMNAFTALGVTVVVTELDVRIPTPPTAAMQLQQAEDYYSTVAACVNVTGCVGVVVWDFDDTYSWVPSTFAGTGYADLFLQPGGANTPLVKKSAYDAVLQALTKVPFSSP